VIRILIVDDHVMVSEGLASLLGAEADMAVIAAVHRADDAIVAARHHRPDVVLMDYELPDGSGIDAAATILSERRATQVVMLTGSTNEAVLLAALQSGCAGFVTKHKAAEEVVSAVRAAHAGEAVISPAMLARLLSKLTQRDARRARELTSREKEVLALVARGLSNTEAADHLFLSVHTIRHHVQNILAKLEAHSKLEAVSIAIREEIIPPH
jgi:DNA-binding NarL/FixJ family response regulator